jgi:hypothetical protein
MVFDKMEDSEDVWSKYHPGFEALGRFVVRPYPGKASLLLPITRILPVPGICPTRIIAQAQRGCKRKSPGKTGALII